MVARCPERAKWGGLLLGYFLLATQEKVTRAPQAHESSCCQRHPAPANLCNLLRYHNPMPELDTPGDLFGGGQRRGVIPGGIGIHLASTLIWVEKRDQVHLSWFRAHFCRCRTPFGAGAPPVTVAKDSGSLRGDSLISDTSALAIPDPAVSGGLFAQRDPPHLTFTSIFGEIQNMSMIFKALSDSTRRSVLELLRNGPTSAGELADHFNVSKSTMSAHFAVLREAGLVVSEKRGQSVVYELQLSVLEDALLGFAKAFGWKLQEDTTMKPRHSSSGTHK